MATESFFSNASLAYLASAGAGKDGKTYSIKPTDGTGDFTFSRGTDLTATRVGPTGLIEKGRENLLTYSNAFDTLPWVLSNGASVGSRVADPNGGNDAWELNYDGTVGGRIQQQVSITDGGVYVFSIYAKVPSGTRDLQFYTTISASPITITLTTTWQRFELFRTNVGYTQAFPQLRDNTGIAGTIHIYQAQYEAGTIATDYIESGASTGKAGLLENEPRFDYSGGATCPSLLLEPSRTNLIMQSEYLTPINGGAASYNEELSPEGYYNGTSITFGATVNDSATMGVNTSVSILGNTQYTFSFYAKSITGDGTFKVRIDTDTTTSLVGQNITTTSEWDRYTITFTTDAGATSFSGNCRFQAITANNKIAFYGLQLEQGSYPTSYIPNHSGGSATRTAEKQEVTGLTSSVLNQSEGSFYIELQTLSTDAGRVVITSYPTGASNDTIRFIFTNQINFGLVSAGTLGDSTNPTSAKVKVAGTYSGTELKLCVNGGAVQKSSGNFSFANQPTKIYTHAFVDTIRLFADIDQMLYFPTALSDADMITLTT